MMNEWLQRIICFSLFILLTACAGPVEERPLEVPLPSRENIAGLKIITEDGGHLAWSKKTNQIAFDRLGKDGYFDLWLMNPDGSGQKCLTSNHPLLPNKHIGQPAWHPSGKLLVIQAQKGHAPRHPHYLARSFAVAADFDWSPDGSQIMGLVITHRPDTRMRGSGIIVLIDLPTR